MNGIYLRLFRAERLTVGTEWNSRNVQSRFWRFYANDGDGASLLLDDGEWPLRRGELYFVPALVRFSCRNTRPLEHFYVHFDVLGPPPLALRELRGKFCHIPKTDVLAQAVRMISQDRGPLDLLRECRLKSMLYDALALCLAVVPEEARHRSERMAAEMEPVLPALNYIDSHLAEPLTVAVLAACCCLSADTFARGFRRCVGQTPAQYVQERRVTLAAQRLLFTDDTIERIAETCGFGNRSYFSRVFQHQIGESPAAYRKSGQATT